MNLWDMHQATEKALEALHKATCECRSPTDYELNPKWHTEASEWSKECPYRTALSEPAL